jgi:hypothetical protein
MFRWNLQENSTAPRDSKMAAFNPSSNQLERLARSSAILDEKAIPRFKGPLYTDDDVDSPLSRKINQAH